MFIPAFLGAYCVILRGSFILAHGRTESAGHAIGAFQNTLGKGLRRPGSRGTEEGFMKNDVYERVHLQHMPF